MGALMENAVWTELIKNKSLLMDIKFWRTTSKSEIDFVLVFQDQTFPVEVKYQNNVSTIPRTIKTFIDSYGSNRAWVMTKNQSFELNYRNCSVTFLPAFFSSKILTGVIH